MITRINFFLLRVPLLILVSGLLSCTSIKVKKDLPVSSEVMASAQSDAKAQHLFLDAVFNLPVDIVDECHLQGKRLPFWLASSALVRNGLTDEQYTALYKTLGIDENWRVLKTEPGLGLSEGDIVESVDDSSLGDPQKWPHPNLSITRNTISSDDYQPDQTIKVQVKDKGTIEVPIRKGCYGFVHGFSYFKMPGDIKFSHVAPRRIVVIPASAIKLIKTPDEAAFAALWGYYGTSSKEADEADTKLRFQVFGSLILLSPLNATPIGFLATNAAFNAGGGAKYMQFLNNNASGGLPEQADAWAIMIMAKYGYDPAAAITLNEKIAASKAEKNIFSMDERRLATAKALVQKLKSTNTSVPLWETRLNTPANTRANMPVMLP